MSSCTRGIRTESSQPAEGIALKVRYKRQVVKCMLSGFFFLMIGGGMMRTAESWHPPIWGKTYPVWRVCKKDCKKEPRKILRLNMSKRLCLFYPPVQSRYIATVARMSLWVSKSGKKGFGVTLRLQGKRSKMQSFRMLKASFTCDKKTYSVWKLPSEAVYVLPKQKRFLYLVFPFDNDALWKKKKVLGTLSLKVAIGLAKPFTWSIPLVQQLRTFHHRYHVNACRARGWK